MDPVELTLFASRIEAVCDEMGAVLQRTAFSPNIKDRLDFSCAVFDAAGHLVAQAAHIPVHLGSMAFAMRGIVGQMEWREGDAVILNDPFLGGTHLPDVTVISPLFHQGECVGFVANRAHHADIGAASPGSMPLSHTLEEEGVVIPPTYLARSGSLDETFFQALLPHAGEDVRGDFVAQWSANLSGAKRLHELIHRLGASAYQERIRGLNDYAERLARSALERIPDGVYRFEDFLDDDGAGNRDPRIVVRIAIAGSDVTVDFDGTSAQTAGNVNCPLSVAAAGVFYVFRCLMPPHTPACAGSLRPIALSAPEGTLLNARRPAAVAAGNVETSTRVVDVVMGALAQALPDRIPAASHGTMNNIAMGARGQDHWDYYETVGGGMGAGRHGGGLSAVQTHMTNTRNTPIEAIEMNYPLRVRRYAIRRGTGGAGERRGGDGVVREFEFLRPATVTLLTERRHHAPWGLAGGAPGACGANTLNGQVLPAKVCVAVRSGDRITLLTPGGGGWGRAPRSIPRATS